MECRLVFIVKTVNELISKLNEFVEGKEYIENCISGDSKKFQRLDPFIGEG